MKFSKKGIKDRRKGKRSQLRKETNERMREGLKETKETLELSVDSFLI